MNISQSALKQIILEELTKADKDEIERISKKAAEDAIHKAFKEELEKELIKTLGKKASEEEIVKITKKILKKFYRELVINYPQLIDRLKL